MHEHLTRMAEIHSLNDETQLICRLINAIQDRNLNNIKICYKELVQKIPSIYSNCKTICAEFMNCTVL